VLGCLKNSSHPDWLDGAGCFGGGEFGFIGFLL
jgi:hypothetical protein